MSYTAEQQEEKIRGLRERIAEQDKHANELNTAAMCWKEHAEKLETALEAILILHKCHHPRDAGHAMDVAFHIAKSASQLPQPDPIPCVELPF